IYTYQALLEFAVASYYVGRHADAIAASNVLLRESRLPLHLVAQVIANRRLSVEAMFPRQAGPPTSTPLHVVTAVRGATTALDDTVDSLLRQQDGAFVAALLDDASCADIGERLQPVDTRVALMSFAAATGERHRIETYVGERCAGGDLVVVLPEGARLADAGTLQRIRATFDDPACTLAYGQWRTAAGK